MNESFEAALFNLVSAHAVMVGWRTASQVAEGADGSVILFQNKSTTEYHMQFERYFSLIAFWKISLRIAATGKRHALSDSVPCSDIYRP